MRHSRPVCRRPSRFVRPVLEELEPRRTPSATDVRGYHNDPASTGQNLTETVLTPANVNPTSFGQKFSTGVDGQVYAQPLYGAGVNVTVGPSPGVHNVVFVATQHDSLYAIDADAGGILWHATLLNPVHGGAVTPVPSADVGIDDISPEIGVTSTPVIDRATNTLYVEAKTKEVAGDGAHYVHQLYAFDLGSGALKLGSPAVIADSIGDTFVSGPTVPGTGVAAANGQVQFLALRQLSRAGLTLAGGVVYLAFGSHGDLYPYHGWILGYDATTLAPRAVFNTTPNGTEGGIWQAGGRIAVDPQGYLYVETGNGTNDDTAADGFPSGGDYGNSFLKLVVDPTSDAGHPNVNGWGLKVVDYFTVSDTAYLNANDLDLGSGGPVVLPDAVGSATHPHLLVGSGKEGLIYLIDRDHMGHFDPAANHVVQEVPGPSGGEFGTPAFFNKVLYFVGVDGTVQAFAISHAHLGTRPTVGRDVYGFPGATPSVSAAGTRNAILWAVDHGTNELRAYAPGSRLKEIYTSDRAAGGRDALGPSVKFAVPTVSNGHVYVGAADALVAYGLLTPPAQAPAAPSGLVALAISDTQVRLTWKDRSTPPNLAGGFEVELAAGSGDFSPAGTAPAGDTFDTVGGLTPGVTYTFRVRAVNAVGASAYSAPVTITFTAPAHASRRPSAAGGLGPALKPAGPWEEADGA